MDKGMDRRQFIIASAVGLAMSGMAGFSRVATANAADSIQLPALPYPINGLEPYISARTLEFHHGKHHAAYVANVVKMTSGAPFNSMSLEEIIRKSGSDATLSGLFNNSAQVWNHDFYWKCMKPGGGGEPSGEIAAKIKTDFGEFAKFKDSFAAAAKGQFGSGWAWLVLKNGKLDVMKTANADLPLLHGAKALLTVDVWEHAYYLDYQNQRADYVNAFIDHLINWNFVNQNMKG